MELDPKLDPPEIINKTSNKTTQSDNDPSDDQIIDYLSLSEKFFTHVDIAAYFLNIDLMRVTDQQNKYYFDRLNQLVSEGKLICSGGWRFKANQEIDQETEPDLW